MARLRARFPRTSRPLLAWFRALAKRLTPRVRALGARVQRAASRYAKRSPFFQRLQSVQQRWMHRVPKHWVQPISLVLFFAVLGIGWALVSAPSRRPHRRPARVAKKPVLPLAGVTVLLDPGHGGLDSGAVVRWSEIPAIPPTPAVPAKPAVPAQSAIPARSALPARNGSPAVPARPAVPAKAAIPAQPARPARPGRPGIPGGRVREDMLNYRFAATLARTLREQGATVRFTVVSDALKVNLREGKTEPPLQIPSDARSMVSGVLMKVAPSYLWLRGQAGIPLWQAWQARPIRQTPGRGLYFLSLHHDKVSERQVRGARICCDVRAGEVPIFARTLAHTLAQAGVAEIARDGNGRLDGRHLGVLNPQYNPIPQKALLEIATFSNRRDRENALSPIWRWHTAHLVTRAIVECERK